MPLRSVRKGEVPAEALAECVKEAEANGEIVVQVMSWSNDWIVITQGGKRTRTATAPPVETRAKAKGSRK
jgi:hypothetical protein